MINQIKEKEFIIIEEAEYNRLFEANEDVGYFQYNGENILFKIK